MSHKSITTPSDVRPCADCGTDLWMQSKHYFEESDGSLTRHCLPCGKERDRREARES